MKTLRTPTWLALLAAVITSCTTPTTGTGPTGAAGVSAAAGTWRFSHTGAPTIWKEGLDDPAAFLRENMKDMVIEIQPDGSASMLAMGRTGTFQLTARDESDLAVTLAADGAESGQQAWTYDKRKRLLILPLELDVDGSKGTMPAYFKRK